MAMNKYQATGVSSGQEGITITDCAEGSALTAQSECSMTWTKHDVLCSYTSYCTVALVTNSMEKKKGFNLM